MALIVDPNSSPDAAAPAGDLIKDSSTATFMADVIEASAQVPVIVDFWAPWCGPCKTLGPAIEKIVRQGGGIVRLVKINVDENQDLAAQMGVRSIPAVFGFRQGRPVDGFAGAVPESQIRSFVDRLTGGAKAPVDTLLEQAKAMLDAGDPATATRLYAQALNEDPGRPAAVAGMIRCFLAVGDTARAREAVNSLPDDILRDPEVAGAVSALELSEQAPEGDGDALAEKVEADPDDHQARFDLALALYGAGQTESAIEHLVEIVRRDRAWNDDAARKQLLKIFEALGFDHPMAVDGRRRLRAILYS